MHRFFIASCVSALATVPVLGQAASPPDTSTTVTFSGFVDAYYAHDFGRPADFDRSFTTQPARHNEFNVNLAFIEARLVGPKVRGRLALQAGTSVQSNYAGEPTIGSVSGPSLSRLIQEAVAGVRLGRSVWIDGGIFFSHIGMESFISRDNLTYTRSLSADYTPYYESGAKLTWQPSPALTATFVVMNGWQNISENNPDKAVGGRLDFSPDSSASFSFYSFVGKEGDPGMLRILNGIGAKTIAVTGLTLQANVDYGIQNRDNSDDSHWYSAALIAKAQPTRFVSVAGRIERYVDPDQTMIVTQNGGKFIGTMASLGLDVSLPGADKALWRNEVRGTWTGDAVFPSRSATGLSKHNYVVVTSLALTF